jgi:type II secretory pathway pseudopilin PulG
MAIIAAALLVLVGGLGVSSTSVRIIEQRVSAENLARRQIELIKAAPYRVNPTTVPYPILSNSGVYSVTVDVSYWVSPTFVSVMPNPTTSPDSGLQRINVRLHSSQHAGGPVFSLEGYKVNRP